MKCGGGGEGIHFVLNIQELYIVENRIVEGGCGCIIELVSGVQ